MSVIQITSETILADVEQHFRVSAGPGAGKTFWLVKHIKNVLHKSERLGKISKIACITYTNIAVDTILERLGTSVGQVEVSTIHSFLYKHVVKPYAAFIASEYDLNLSAMDGHDEILYTFGKLKEWADKTGQVYLYQDKNSIKAKEKQGKVFDALYSLQWQFDTGNNLVIKPNPKKAWIGKIDAKVSIRNDSYLEFKRIYWKLGILHHDDVLFFSHEIILRFPFVVNVLKAKFPYFFIDEFQDSNPIQVEILRIIGENDVVVGLIGDKAQSIYGFQGADPSLLQSFSLPGIVNYEMADNRRSNKEIVNFLNSVRTDFKQNPTRSDQGEKITIIVGDMVGAVRWAKSTLGVHNIYSLSRNNITSNEMKQEISGVIVNDSLFDKLIEADSNSERKYMIIGCLKAVELSREKKFKEAIKVLSKIFLDRTDKETGKREALKHVSNLLSHYNDFKGKTLFDFYSTIKAIVAPNISDLRNGSAKSFYESHSYQQLALCVKVPEDVSQNKTIHKAKGDEFDNVLLVLKKESDLDFILNPNINDTTSVGEEQRINYVGVSRAKNRLFISVPTLSEGNKAILSLRFQIEQL